MGDLSAADEHLIPIIVRGLKDKINPENAIGAKKIVGAMKSKGYDITIEKLRRIIHVIRVRGLITYLIVTGKQ